ncbi:MAG: DNA-protecting protein DprA [Candidatus Omnitrophota bacterium]|nr:MAG: DNA-protecting protein DprA [Candidatus Omnitrophota bacterium]
MTELEALVKLNMAAGIGSIRLNRLLEYFNRPQDILEASPDKLVTVSGINYELADKIINCRNEDLDKEFKQARDLGIKIITQDNSEYPHNLKHISDPPIVLYIKGELKREDALAIAIVGSRQASFYGLSFAQKFAADLSVYGITIVSGMARGIDTYAHKGALKSGGRTIAVIGSGFKHIYPAENLSLAEEIAEKGAVISEFSLDSKPLKQNFPRRNRLISGLSLGVLVAEAAKNSGALITSDFALEQGREVFAIPGKIDSANSSGVNSLIQQGAKPVTCVDDILEEFDERMFYKRRFSSERKQVFKADKIQSLCARESLIYNNICREPVLFDEIISKSACGIADVFQALFGLEMKKLIKQLPGKKFIRS